MRFLTADYLFPLDHSPIKNGVLQISREGEIIKVFNNREEAPSERLEIFQGVISPGFINAHCHLELSHMHGFCKKKKGLLDFINQVNQRDSFSKEKILLSIALAEKQMMKNGIVAVGDICNTTDTILQKQKKNLQYYNFIEGFGVKERFANQKIKELILMRNQFRDKGLDATIVPHAPYSVTPKLNNKIMKAFDRKDKLFSIHMQESKSENQFFEERKGSLFQWIMQIQGSAKIWSNRQKSIDFLTDLKNQKMLLVHNTFAREEDMLDQYYCTCPKANLYIEGVLPDYTIFNYEKLCVGTDSLASNTSLSILEELFIIQENSNYCLDTLLRIGSRNGAEALGFNTLGTFKVGKKPGVILIEKLKNLKIQETSKVKKLD